MTYTREQVQDATLKYFDGDVMATNIWIDKYALKDRDGNLYELTPEDMHHRLAKEFARVENNYPNPITEETIFKLLEKFKYIVPSGSPMEGIGNDFKIQSLSNCYVIGSDEDSYGSILKIDEEQVHIMRRRGGVGSDLSHLRPKGAKTSCAANTSTGIVPFAERYSNSTRETAQDGRRGARMLSLDITHPDAEEFIDAKLELKKITGANVSVRITDEFMDCVKENECFIQKFPIDLFCQNLTTSNYEYDKLYNFDDGLGNVGYIKKKDSKKLWNKIIHNAWKSAEPGILFIDQIRRESPSDCYGTDWKSVSSNPCGEIPMNPYSSCILACLNLYSYVVNSFEIESYFDFDLFKEHVRIGQRLIDDIVDLEIEKIDQILKKVKSDPESTDTKFRELNLWNKIKIRIKEGRRTGLGITAEGDMLAALNLRYGSEEASDFSVELHKIMAVESYKSSIKLAKERGCFPIWDGEKEIDNPFLDRIYNELDNSDQLDWGLYGRRNIANLTIAPTGSVSILTKTTSGIEPCFKVYYKRRRKINDKSKATFVDEQGDMWEEYRVFHHKFLDWARITKWLTKEEVMKMSDEDLEKLFKDSPYYKATSSDVDYIGKVELQGRVQKWIDHSISVTVNMPKEATEEMVSQVYMKAYETGCKGITVYREGSRNGVLISDDSKDKQSIDIVYNDAPKRPETLKCDVYSMSRGKQAYTIIVGLLDSGKPYEIFALEKLSNVEFSDKITKAKLRKVKSRTYELVGFSNTTKYIVDNIIDHMSQDEQKDTRKYSIQLRHGIHPKHIIGQIEEYATITSFDKVVSKTLSNYLGEEKLKGEEVCPNCGGELKYEGGCVQCTNPECGWSKCS